jgi:predicted metal-dependent HD superfamily phosphohydrolase
MEERVADDAEDLMRDWTDLVRRHTTDPAAEATGRALLHAWSEPHRRYHGLSHLRGILSRVEELVDYATDADAVRLAAWYHDAVYQCRKDDEERSAQLAEADLAALLITPSLVAEVGRLVRLTVKHNPADDDCNGQVLCDADLATLGSAPEHYQANTDAIRAEYAHVSQPAFRDGRASQVRQMLASSSVFHTPLARSRWECQARENLADELRDLMAENT